MAGINWDEINANIAKKEKSAPVQPEQPSAEDKGFLGTIMDVGKGLVSGAFLKEPENIAQGVHDTANFIDEQAGTNAIDDDTDYDFVPDVLKPETSAGKTAQSIAAFTAGWVTGGKLIGMGAKALPLAGKLASTMPKASKVVGNVLKGGVVDFFSGDGSDERLADTIVDNDLLGSSLAQYLASDKDDSLFEGRLKNVVEGFIVGGALDTTMSTFRFMKKGFKESAKGALDGAVAARKEGAEKLAEVVGKEPDEAAKLIEQYKKEGKWVSINPDDLTDKAHLRMAKETISKQVDNMVPPKQKATGQAFNDAGYSDGARTLIEECQDALGFAVEPLKMDAYKIKDDAIEYLVQNNLQQSFDKSKLILATSEVTDQRVHTAARALWLDLYAPDYMRQSLQKMSEGVEGAAVEAKQRLGDIFDVLYDLKASNMAGGQQTYMNNVVNLVGEGSKKAANVVDAKQAFVLGKELIADVSDTELAELLHSLTRAGENCDLKTMMQIVGSKAAKGSATRAMMGVTDDVWDNIMRYRYASMLSSMKTHIRNFSGNTIKLPLLAFEESVKGAVTGFSGKTGAYNKLVGALNGSKEGLYFLQGMKWSLPQAWDTFRSSMKYAEAITRPNSEYGMAAKKATKLWEMPLRILGAADEFFASLVGGAKSYEEAVKSMKSQGVLNGITDIATQTAIKQKYVEDFLAKSFMETTLSDGSVVKKGALALTDAVKMADEATYQQALGKFGKDLSKLINNHKPMKVLFPFVKTPINIFKDVFWTRNPLMATKEVYNALQGTDVKAQAEAVAHLTSGIAMYLTAYDLVAGGKILGQGPDNKFQKNAKMANGISFNSFKIGDSYYSLDAIEPYGSLLGFWATTIQALQENDDELFSAEGAGALMESLIVTAKDKTFLKGLGDLMNSIDRGQALSDRGMFTQVGISFIPSLLRDLGQSIDPVRRQDPDFFSKVQNRLPSIMGIPGRSGLAPKIDWLTGSEQEYAHGGGVASFIDAYGSTKEMHSAVLYDLARLTGVQDPSDTIQGYKLSPQELADYYKCIGTLKIGGRTLYDTLTEVIMSDAYQNSPDTGTETELGEKKNSILKNIIDEYKNAGKAEFLRNNPQVKPKTSNGLIDFTQNA